MEHYYFVVNDKLKGPIPLYEIIEMKLSENTLVWKKGMSDWAKLKNLTIPPDVKESNLK